MITFLPNTTNSKDMKGMIEIDPKEMIATIVQTEDKDIKEASVMIEATGTIVGIAKGRGRDRGTGTDTRRDNQAKIDRGSHITLRTVDDLQQIILTTILKGPICPVTVIVILLRHSIYDSSWSGRLRCGRVLSFFGSKSQCGSFIKLCLIIIDGSRCSVLSSSLQYGFL